MTRLAEVWRTKTVHRPSLTLESVTKDWTFEVMSKRPCPRVSTLNCLTIRPGLEGRDRGKFLSFQELEKRSARGRHVVDLVRDAVPVDCRHGVAPARDRESLGLGDGARERLGALRIGLFLEHPDRAVPDDRAGFRELGRIGLRGPGPDIEDHLVRLHLAHRFHAWMSVVQALADDHVGRKRNLPAGKNSLRIPDKVGLGERFPD